MLNYEITSHKTLLDINIHGLSKISRQITKTYISNSFVHSILENTCKSMQFLD